MNARVPPSLLANAGRVFFDTQAEAEGARLTPGVKRVEIDQIRYKRAVSEPSHSLKFEDGLGNWWEIDFKRHDTCTPHLDPAWDDDDAAACMDCCNRWFEAYLTNLAASHGALVISFKGADKLTAIWDGATGSDFGIGVAVTGINQRCIFDLDVADWPLLKHVLVNVSDTELLMGGDGIADWAAFMFVHGARFTLRGSGGRHDFINKPYTQGTVTAVQDETSPGANDGYVDIEIDAEFDPTQSPSWAADGVSEVIGYTDNSFQFGQVNDRAPLWFAMDRNEYAGGYTGASFTDQGGGVWRISGLTGAEIVSFNSYAPVNTYVVVKSRTDGPVWYGLFDCPSVDIRDTVFHTALMRCGFVNGGGTVRIEGNRVEPREGSRSLVTAMRGVWDVFNTKGSIKFTDNYVFGSGDDAFAPVGYAFVNITRLTATSLRMFSNAHFFGDKADAGREFILYDNNYTEACRFRIVSSGAINTGSGWVADYSVTVTSGSMPGTDGNALTNYVAADTAGNAWVQCTDNEFVNIRSRAIWGNLMGQYNNNRFDWITNEAIMINPAGGGSGVSYFYGGGSRLQVNNNIIRRAVANGYWTAPIHIFGSTVASDLVVATQKPIKLVQVHGNLFDTAPHMFILLSGVNGFSVRDNYGETCGGWATTNYSILDDIGITEPVGAVTYKDCQDGVIGDNTWKSLLNSVTVTAAYGTNTDVRLDGDTNLDLTTPERTISSDLRIYRAGANTSIIIEAASTYNASIKFKNGESEWQIFGSNYGLFFKDVEANLNRMAIDQNGYLVAGADNTYDIGYSGASRFRVIYAANRFEAPTMAINGSAGTSRQLRYQTGGLARWYAAASNEAETGANAGSNYLVTRYDDAGTYIDSPLSINRATGIVTLTLGASTNGSYKVNAVDVVKARKTGWAVATGTATRTTFATGSVTLPELAERVKALIDDLHATAGHGLIGT